MRLQYSLLELCLCFLQLNAHLAVDARHAVLPRQDGPMPTQGPASVTATHPVFSENPIPDASRSAARPSKTPSEASNPAISSDTSLTSDGSALPTSSVAPSVLISSPLPSTISTAPDVASPPLSTDLPITPAITPALSVAGAILILTGPFYALVGIKNKWLQVFLSSAYLTSLAVTVLIVYVMHPPVSNAIQGAYLVAACMTGLIFGGGSLIFADITEALACLLGGFSLAMWFLVLVPGGLIRSTAGKAIFIGCFILGSFGFYTSRWTRAYGIIGSTAFAGATVIVLGIDCFSRAGLKEFWLYIWGLNDDIFPLHYNGPYPITRGIRVEIAAIIICFLIGVMSQMKIWKVVKRRREEKATERLRQEELQEHAEVAIGKEIEERTAHNRVLWEGAYNTRHGNDRHDDSGISMTAANPRKELSSSNISSQWVGPSATTIELEELEGDNNVFEETSQSRGKDKTRATVTATVAPKDDNLAIMSAPASVVTENQSLSAAEIGPSQEADPSLVKTEEVETERPSFGPDAVPLPFKIPSSDFNADRRSSIAASIASDHFSTRVLDRLSGGSLRRTSSQRSQRSYTATSINEEVVMTPHDDKDDGASSVAANVDEISDGQQSDVDKTASAVPPEPDAEENGLQKPTPSIEQHLTDDPGHNPSLNEASPESAVGTDEEAPEALIAKHEPITGEECSGRDETPENESLLEEEQISSSPTDMEVTTPPAPESAKAEPSLQERLADLSGTSKVMMVYRTNEWAKHLDDAEKPTTDDLKAENSTIATPTEKPAPVNIPALQQTALNASPAPVVPPPHLTPPPQSTTKSKQHSTPQNAREPSNPYPFPQRKPPANPFFDRQSSQSSLDSLSSQRITRPPQNHRTSYPPPIAEHVPSTTRYKHHSTPPIPQGPPNPYPSLQHKLSSSNRHASYSSLDTLPSQRTTRPPHPRRTSQRLPPQQTRPQSLSLQRSKYYRRASAPLLVHPPIKEGVPSTTFPDRATTPIFPTITTTLMSSQQRNLPQSRPTSTGYSPPSTYPPTSTPVPAPSLSPSLHKHNNTHNHHQHQQRRQENYRGVAFYHPSAFTSSPPIPSSPFISPPFLSSPATTPSPGQREQRRSTGGKGFEERHREGMRRLQMRAVLGGSGGEG